MAVAGSAAAPGLLPCFAACVSTTCRHQSAATCCFILPAETPTHRPGCAPRGCGSGTAAGGGAGRAGSSPRRQAWTPARAVVGCEEVRCCSGLGCPHSWRSTTLARLCARLNPPDCPAHLHGAVPRVLHCHAVLDVAREAGVQDVQAGVARGREPVVVVDGDGRLQEGRE